MKMHKLELKDLSVLYRQRMPAGWGGPEGGAEGKRDREAAASVLNMEPVGNQ